MAWNKKFAQSGPTLAVATLLPACAVVFGVAFLVPLGQNAPFLIFLPAVMMAALMAGFVAGACATLVSACLALLWEGPLGGPGAASADDGIGAMVFLMTGCAIAFFAELWQRNRRRCEEEELRARLAAEREQSQLILQRERNLLRQVIDAMPSTIFVKDAGGILHLANEAMARFHATSVGELEGKLLEELRIVPEEFTGSMREGDQRVIGTGKPVHAEVQVPDAQGVPHLLETSKWPLFNEDGSCDKILIVTRDITEHKQAQEALQENRELLDSIVSGTPDCIYVKNSAGQYALFNRAAQRMLGKSSAEVLGKKDHELFPHDAADSFIKEDLQVTKSGSVAIFEQYLTDANGRERVLLSTKGPIFDDQGAVTGVFGISRDITEQKHAEEEIRKLNEELDQRVAERTEQLEAAIKEQEAFSYTVSHDLRSPLRHINSYTTILAEECGDALSREGVENLEKICKASNKMGQLIDDLLELARTSRMPLKEEPINLTRLATISSLMLQQTDKGRRVEFSIAEGMEVLGDKTLVRLVMDNLLGNAWKYTAQEKVALIEVGWEEMEGQQVFYVSDNGTGFDMQYKDKLFGAFQRLHGAEDEGNGIGLATVKRAVERHGGAIWAEGEEGTGATFYFTLGQEAIPCRLAMRQQQAG